MLFLITSRAEANGCSDYFINNFDYKYETIISNIYDYELNSFDSTQIIKEKERINKQIHQIEYFFWTKNLDQKCVDSNEYIIRKEKINSLSVKLEDRFSSFLKNNNTDQTITPIEVYCKDIDNEFYFKTNQFCGWKDRNNNLFYYRVNFNEYRNNRSRILENLVVNKDLKLEKFCLRRPDVEICKKIEEPQSDTIIPNDEFAQRKNKIITDVIGPKILIPNEIRADENMNAYLEGKLIDDSVIMIFTVNQTPVKFQMNGSFSIKRYVPPNGENITLRAIDEWGNSSQKIIRLIRGVEEKTIIANFEKLQPNLIKGKINSNSAALILGIEEHDQQKFPDVDFAKNDADYFKDYAIQVLGVPSSNVKKLINSQASRTNTLEILRTWLPLIINPNTTLYIFYAGHGYMDANKNMFLIPYDASPTLLKDSAFLRNDFFKEIEKHEPKQVVAFFDTCFSGFTRNGESIIEGDRDLVIVDDETNIPDNFILFSASSGAEFSSSHPQIKHGLFSYYLMLGLQGNADENKDRHITSGELHRYIKENVSKLSITLKGRSQTPQLIGNNNKILVNW